MTFKSGASSAALAIGAMTPAERTMGRYMRAPDHDGGGADGGAGAGGGAGGSDGGAAALLGGDGGSGAGGGGDGGAGGGAGAGGEGGSDADWLEKFSAEGGDAENPSNRDWLKAKGFKSLDDVATSYREAEKSLRSGGKITVPGEGAKPEEVAAYHKAIGVPESADKYEVVVPEGGEIDAAFADPMKEVALKAGVPAEAFKALSEGLVKHQLDQLEAMKTAEDGDADAKLKEWGADKDAKLADVSAAMKALNLSKTDVAAIQRGFHVTYGTPGSARTLDLLQKLGAGMAEDALIGGGKGRFGITGAEAQAEVDKLIVDREFQAKLAAKEPAAVARWDRLNGAIAADKDRKNREAAN